MRGSKRVTPSAGPRGPTTNDDDRSLAEAAADSIRDGDRQRVFPFNELNGQIIAGPDLPLDTRSPTDLVRSHRAAPARIDKRAERHRSGGDSTFVAWRDDVKATGGRREPKRLGVRHRRLQLGPGDRAKTAPFAARQARRLD